MTTDTEVAAYRKRTIWLQRLPNGDFADWGRNGTGQHRGEGGARYYTGEAAKVLALVVAHSTQAKPPAGHKPA